MNNSLSNICSGRLRAGVSNITLMVFILSLIVFTDVSAVKRYPGRNPIDAEEFPPGQSAVTDPYEPNDAKEIAPALEWNISDSQGWYEVLTETAVMGSILDFDFFCLYLSRGDSLMAGFSSIEGLQDGFVPMLSLLDSSGTVLASSFGSEAVVSSTAQYDGRYYLLVNDYAILNPGSRPEDGEWTYVLGAKRLMRRGDMDGNGSLDYRDAFLVFVLASGLRDSLSFTVAQRMAADLDGDGRVAGDMDDFLLIIRSLNYIPSRDPGIPDKNKAGSSGPSLTTAGDGTWRLEFSDGSSLKLSYGELPTLDIRGMQAMHLLGIMFSKELADMIPPAVLPETARLERNQPNPFNPSTSISFFLGANSRARLAVFDTRGRIVKTLFNGQSGSGAHTVCWDGTDARGHKMPSGVYFYRLETDQKTQTRKMILLK